MSPEPRVDLGLQKNVLVAVSSGPKDVNANVAKSSRGRIPFNA